MKQTHFERSTSRYYFNYLRNEGGVGMFLLLFFLFVFFTLKIILTPMCLKFGLKEEDMNVLRNRMKDYYKC